MTKRVASQALADARADPASLARSGSPTSARRSSAGTRDSGEPVHRALVWQDRRTAARCDELATAGHERSGARAHRPGLDPYFSATKIEWLLRNVEAARGRRLRDDRLVARVQAHRPPRHRRHQRLADDAVRHRRASLGPRALRAARASTRSALPEPLPSAARLRDHLGVRRRGPGRRDRGRPAGGALRAGLPAAGDGEEHLRHRQLRPAQRRRRGCPSRARAC